MQTVPAQLQTVLHQTGLAGVLQRAEADDHEDDCADDCADDCVDHRDAKHSGHHYWAHFQTLRDVEDDVEEDDDDYRSDLARANVLHGNPGEEDGARMVVDDAVVEHQQMADGYRTAAPLLHDAVHCVDHQADAAKLHPHCRSESDDPHMPRLQSG